MVVDCSSVQGCSSTFAAHNDTKQQADFLKTYFLSVCGVNTPFSIHSFIHSFIHFILPLTRNTTTVYRNTLKIIYNIPTSWSKEAELCVILHHMQESLSIGGYKVELDGSNSIPAYYRLFPSFLAITHNFLELTTSLYEILPTKFYF